MVACRQRNSPKENSRWGQAPHPTVLMKNQRSSQLSQPQTAAQDTLPWAYSMAFFSEQQQRIRSLGLRPAPMAAASAVTAAMWNYVKTTGFKADANDSKIVAAAGRSYIEALLRAGVEVYYYQHNFLHSKAIVVDGYLSIVGTANMDHRSYEQNFEIAAFVYGEKTAKYLVDGFERENQ